MEKAINEANSSAATRQPATRSELLSNEQATSSSRAIMPVATEPASSGTISFDPASVASKSRNENILEMGASTKTTIMTPVESLLNDRWTFIVRLNRATADRLSSAIYPDRV